MEKRDEQTYAIIGAAMEVHRALGNGFLEQVYAEALAIEFEANGITFEKEKAFDIYYRDRKLSCQYRADFLCFGSVIVEIKALTELGANEESQLINYLKASGIARGLLINFGKSSLQHRRFIRSHK